MDEQKPVGKDFDLDEFRQWVAGLIPDDAFAFGEQLVWAVGWRTIAAAFESDAIIREQMEKRFATEIPEASAVLAAEKHLPTKEALVAYGFRRVLQGLGLDLEDPHLKETPERAARAWYNELCSGITQPKPKITTFPVEGDEMVLLTDIPVRSLCSHHLLPFYGTAAVAYIPGTNNVLLGVSKLSRVVDYWARRPQVQEALTVQIADYLAKVLGVEDNRGMAHVSSGGVGVVLRAEHMCMSCRGVKHKGEMITSAMRGVFFSNPQTRAEFLQLIEPRR